jgi:hypothetical protein
VATALRAAREQLAGQQTRLLRTGAWHGDWNPGNCTIVGDEVLVWDWERYDPEVPAGFDALHLHLQSALDAGTAPRAAAEGTLAAAPRLLAPFGVPGADAALVAALYLWTLGVRYAGDGQEEAGSPVGRLGEWLIPVLGDALARVRSAADATSSGGVVG